MLSFAATAADQGWTFDELCVPLRAELVRFAQRQVRDKARADDIVQESLLKAWQAWPRFVPDGDPHVAARAWLYRIVANTFTTAYHHERIRREAAKFEHDDIMHATYGVTMEPDARESHVGGVSDDVLIAIAELSPDHRSVVELYYLRDMGCEEIARELGVPKNTAMTRLHRARAALAPKLKRYARAEYGLGGADEDALEAPQGPRTDTHGVDRVVAKDDGGTLELAQAAMY